MIVIIYILVFAVIIGFMFASTSEISEMELKSKDPDDGRSNIIVKYGEKTEYILKDTGESYDSLREAVEANEDKLN